MDKMETPEKGTIEQAQSTLLVQDVEINPHRRRQPKTTEFVRVDAIASALIEYLDDKNFET